MCQPIFSARTNRLNPGSLTHFCQVEPDLLQNATLCIHVPRQYDQYCSYWFFNLTSITRLGAPYFRLRRQIKKSQVQVRISMINFYRAYPALVRRGLFLSIVLLGTGGRTHRFVPVAWYSLILFLFCFVLSVSFWRCCKK